MDWFAAELASGRMAERKESMNQRIAELDAYTKGLKHSNPEIRRVAQGWWAQENAHRSTGERGVSFMLSDARSKAMRANANGDPPVWHVDEHGFFACKASAASEVEIELEAVQWPPDKPTWYNSYKHQFAQLIYKLTHSPDILPRDIVTSYVVSGWIPFSDVLWHLRLEGDFEKAILIEHGSDAPLAEIHSAGICTPFPGGMPLVPSSTSAILLHVLRADVNFKVYAKGTVVWPCTITDVVLRGGIRLRHSDGRMFAMKDTGPVPT